MTSLILKLLLGASAVIPQAIGDVEGTVKKIEADPDLQAKFKDGIVGAAKVLGAVAALL